MTEKIGKGKGAPKAAPTASGAVSKGIPAAAESGAYHDPKPDASEAAFEGPVVWSVVKRGISIKAGLRRYKGNSFFDIREWGADGTTPGKKGVTLSPDSVADLAHAMLAWAGKRAA